MQRSKAVMTAAAASILMVFISAVLVLNAGLFGASADNVGKLTPTVTAGATPATVTVYLDPATSAPASPTGSSAYQTPAGTSQPGSLTDKGGHGEQEDHDD